MRRCGHSKYSRGCETCKTHWRVSRQLAEAYQPIVRSPTVAEDVVAILRMLYDEKRRGRLRYENLTAPEAETSRAVVRL